MKPTAREALVAAYEQLLDAFEELYPTKAEAVVAEVERQTGHDFGPVERPDRLAEAERSLRLTTAESSLAMRDCLDGLKRTGTTTEQED